MPKSKGEKNRGKIVAAANRLFYERGFNPTSFADVALASGIPKGNFYFYFRTKDDLLRAVMDDRQTRFHALLESWKGDIAEPAKRLERMVDILLVDSDDVVRYGCPMGSLAAELGKQQPGLRETVAAMMQTALVFATEQFSELGQTKAQAGRHARELLARLQGAALMAYTFEDASWTRDQAKAVKDWLRSL